MTLQPFSQTMIVLILPSILHSKGNQTVEFVQLIEYNKINIFLEICRKRGMETSSRPLFAF